MERAADLSILYQHSVYHGELVLACNLIAQPPSLPFAHSSPRSQ